MLKTLGSNACTREIFEKKRGLSHAGTSPESMRIVKLLQIKQRLLAGCIVRPIKPDIVEVHLP